MGGGEWKVAYADFTTAMMAFFLLMWLLNAATEEQKAGIAGYFQPGSNYGASASSSTVANNPIVQFVDKLSTREMKLNEIEQSQLDVAKELKQFLLQDAKDLPSAGITSDGIGVLLRVANNAMFTPGSIEFSDEGKKILNEASHIMSKYKMYLVVRGHADSTESGSPYTSKWDLSSARANAAVRYLIEKGVNPNMVRGVAYADTRPLKASNVSGANETNSRVEFSFHRPEIMSTSVNY